VKIIAGAVAPDAGTIEFDGRPVASADPAAARAIGVAMSTSTSRCSTA